MRQRVRRRRAATGQRVLAALIGAASVWLGTSLPGISLGTASALGEGLAQYVVTGDAVVSPLLGLAGDAARGEAIVRDRETGNCLICHRIPEAAERFMGDVGPDLSDVGSRLTAGQIRLRLVDQRRLNPATVMPPYHRVEGLTRVDERYRGRPVLNAQAIEDMVAYLSGLRGASREAHELERGRHGR